MFCKRKREEPLKDVLKLVEQADDHQITAIIDAVIYRYAKVFPDWEVMFLSVRKDPALRKQDVEGIIKSLKREE